jgi:hypothetical protein
MGGTARKNFKMFRELCGDENMKNVILTTTMWEKDNSDACEKREEQLKSKHYKSIIDNGGRFARLFKEEESAHELLRLILDNEPTAIRLQEEIIDDAAETVFETSAGKVLSIEYGERIQSFADDLKDAEECESIPLCFVTYVIELVQAMASGNYSKDKASQQDEIRKLREHIEKLQAEQSSLKNNYASERDGYSGAIGVLKFIKDFGQAVGELVGFIGKGAGTAVGEAVGAIGKGAGTAVGEVGKGVGKAVYGILGNGVAAGLTSIVGAFRRPKTQ